MKIKEVWAHQTPVEETGQQVAKEVVLDTDPQTSQSPGDRYSVVEEVLGALTLTVDDYAKVRDQMSESFDKGLGRATNPKAAVKMFPSYVRSIPDGTEQGSYLALDLGGTNFRVLVITLHGSKVEMDNQIYAIPREIMLGPGEQLFDHIAACLSSFAKAKGLSHMYLPLGFTFSFPCVQHGLTSATLVQWTKGFSCAGVEGNDVVEMLMDAVRRRGDVDIDVVSILNDTVGCLMSVAIHDTRCCVGIIVGTGTNAAYMEDLDKVETWDGDRDEPKQVLINTEWGAFGDDGMLDWMLTPFDRQVDSNSLHPKTHVYEKMISGMFLGEVARVVLAKLAKDGLIFKGQDLSRLNTHDKFYTKYISEIESDEEGTFKRCRQVLAELGMLEVSDVDCELVRRVCQTVSTRSAYLAGAGVAAILNRLERDDVTVAMDGSVYRFHPRYHDLMTEIISKLVRPSCKFRLVLSEDGSGKGAAVVASVATRIAHANEPDFHLKFATMGSNKKNGHVNDVDSSSLNSTPS